LLKIFNIFISIRRSPVNESVIKEPQSQANRKVSKSKKFFFEKKNQKTFLLRFARC